VDRPHVLLASREVTPVVRAGGIGRHVANAARLLAPVAEVTVVLPSGLQPASAKLSAAGTPLLDGVADVRVGTHDEEARSRFSSPFHADAAEIAAIVAQVASERRVDLVEVDDYLGLGALLADAAAARSGGLGAAFLAVRLHTTWEMSQVLDGKPLTEAGARWICALERRGLRTADALLAPSRHAAAAYARYYRALAPTVISEPAPRPPEVVPAENGPRVPGPLRLLYAGRLEERKGVRALVEAVVGAPHELELILAGGDTDTAPGGTSMRRHLERLAAGDPRVRLVGVLEPEDLEAAYLHADLVVVPSRFESFGYVLREALAHGRPVLATPTAGFLDLLGDPRSGWLAPGFDAGALRRGLDSVVGDRTRLDELRASAAPRAVLAERNGPDRWAAELLALVPTPPRRFSQVVVPQEATAVVLATGGDLASTLADLRAQDALTVEVVVVAEAPHRVRRTLLEHIDELVLCAPETALKDALDVRHGGGPVLLLEAGERLAPGAVRRLAEALAASGAGVATAWTGGHDPSVRPIGSPEAVLVADAGGAGGIALLAAATALEAVAGGLDPVAWLAAQGVPGVVVPEVLLGPPRHRPRIGATEAAGIALAVIAAEHDLWTD
jgi:glycosyltransferase involved in cell wall biosynthesis